MVFAIGAGIIVGDSRGDPPSTELAGSPPRSRQCQPEEYHASAIVHLEACLGSSGGLEDLQVVLLLANFALLRPVPPELWYIMVSRSDWPSTWGCITRTGRTWI